MLYWIYCFIKHIESFILCICPNYLNARLSKDIFHLKTLFISPTNNLEKTLEAFIREL